MGFIYALPLESHGLDTPKHRCSTITSLLYSAITIYCAFEITRTIIFWEYDLFSFYFSSNHSRHFSWHPFMIIKSYPRLPQITYIILRLEYSMTLSGSAATFPSKLLHPLPSMHRTYFVLNCHNKQRYSSNLCQRWRMYSPIWPHLIFILFKWR